MIDGPRCRAGDRRARSLSIETSSSQNPRVFPFLRGFFLAHLRRSLISLIKQHGSRQQAAGSQSRAGYLITRSLNRHGRAGFFERWFQVAQNSFHESWIGQRPVLATTLGATAVISQTELCVPQRDDDFIFDFSHTIIQQAASYGLTGSAAKHDPIVKLWYPISHHTSDKSLTDFKAD